MQIHFEQAITAMVSVYAANFVKASGPMPEGWPTGCTAAYVIANGQPNPRLRPLRNQFPTAPASAAFLLEQMPDRKLQNHSEDSMKHRKFIANLPPEIAFPGHDRDEPCIRCAIIAAVNDFTDEHRGGKVDGTEMLNTFGDLLAQWIAAIDDPTERKFATEVAGDLLRLRIQKYRETGRYPGGPGQPGDGPTH